MVNAKSCLLESSSAALLGGPEVQQDQEALALVIMPGGSQSSTTGIGELPDEPPYPLPWPVIWTSVTIRLATSWRSVSSLRNPARTRR